MVNCNRKIIKELKLDDGICTLEIKTVIKNSEVFYEVTQGAPHYHYDSVDYYKPNDETNLYVNQLVHDFLVNCH